ncbi:MAG: C45 family autoproteolytic acyltransferase/hydrolase [Cyclobacteriaceae bacterium]
MYHPRLYGTHYEMGLKYGRLLYEKVNFRIPIISEEKRTFGLACYEQLPDFYPELVKEIEGFAEGIQDRAENLGAFLLSLGIFDTTGQCSVFAFRNKESVVVGRNYDMLYDFKKFTESSLVAPKDKFSYIGQSDVFIGRSDGINEKGLFIAMSFVNGTKVQPGIGFHFIIKKVLENCSTTRQAIEIIQTTEVSSANNFIIADTSGDITVVESAPQGSQVRSCTQSKPFVFATNQFVTEEMKAFDNGGTEWSKSSARYDELEEQLSALNQVDLTDAKKILSNKCICLRLRKEQFGTIWSIVANLNALEIERAESAPNINNYQPEKRLHWWLKKRT